MPGTVFSGPLLAAQADYKAQDWGSVSAGAELDLAAGATLRRGINLEAGAEALVQIDASFRKFLAADVNGEAHAAARVQAQVQVPLDLFAEAGLAVRLQAIAEVAAGIKLSLGLDIGDFLALADQDPRLRGTGAKLMRILLDEAILSGGVMAKVAAAAMAYAALSVSGNFVNNPGFTIAAEAGLGLKAGAGFRVFAGFGINEPRRLVRRLVDAVVDESLLSLKAQLSAAGPAALVEQLRVPCKIAFRSCLEIGFELATSGMAFDPQAPAKLAQRCVQVSLEEMQRAVLSAIHDLARQAIDAELEAVAFTQNAWDAVRAQRLALAARLRAMPEEPFDDDGTGSVIQKWADLFAAFDDLAVAAIAQTGQASSLGLPLAQFWSATQLLLVNLARISVGSARASIIGLAPAAVQAAFTGPIAPPPPSIAATIRTELGLASSHVITQDDLVVFLLRPATTTALLAAFPQLSPVIGLLNEVGGDDLQALRRVLGNINGLSFGGAVDAEATLDVLLGGLEGLVTALVDQQLRPQLDAALARTPDYVRLYVDEVVFATLRYTVTTVFHLIRDAVRTKQITPTVLREACSAIVLRLVGRVLVVSADVLSTFALGQVSGALLEAAAHVDDRDGVAEMIANATHLDRGFVAELLEEALEIGAQALAPLPDDQRERVRDLAFRTLDVAPDAAPQQFLASLKDDFFYPNADAIGELALLMGEITRDRLQTAIAAILERAVQLVLEQLDRILQAAEQQVAAWIGDVEHLIDTLAAQIDALLTELAQLQSAVEAAWNQMVDALVTAADRLASAAGRQKVEDELIDHVYQQARGILAGNGIYQMLPNAAKSVVRDVLKDVIRGAIDNALVDRVLDEIGGLSDDLDQLVDDLRALPPGPGIEQRVLDVVLDRLDEAIRERFGSNPHMDLTLTFDFLGRQTIGLGRVDLPIDSVIAVVRSAIADTTAVMQQINLVADRLATFLDLGTDLEEARTHHADVSSAHDGARRTVGDNQAVNADIAIVSPQAAQSVDGDLALTLDIAGMPRSFLGHEAGQARRVIVRLNETDIDLSEFAVSERVAAGGPARPTFGPVVRNPLPVVTAPVRGPAAGGSARARTAAAHTPALLPGQKTKGAAPPRQISGLHQAAAGLFGAPVRPIVRPGLAAGPLPPAAPAAAAPPTPLRLETTIAAARLAPGINTVTVSVVNGEAARRRTAVVSFLVPEVDNLESNRGQWPAGIGAGLPVRKTVPVDLGVLKGFARTAPSPPPAAPRAPAAKAGALRLGAGARKADRDAATERDIAGLKKRSDGLRADVAAVSKAAAAVGQARAARVVRWNAVASTRVEALRGAPPVRDAPVRDAPVRDVPLRGGPAPARPLPKRPAR